MLPQLTWQRKAMIGKNSSSIHSKSEKHNSDRWVAFQSWKRDERSKLMRNTHTAVDFLPVMPQAVPRFRTIFGKVLFSQYNRYTMYEPETSAPGVSNRYSSIYHFTKHILYSTWHTADICGRLWSLYEAGVNFAVGAWNDACWLSNASGRSIKCNFAQNCVCTEN